MPSCFLILQRLFLRVDDVLFRINDTRIYHEFGAPYVVREYTSKEETFYNVLKVRYIHHDLYYLIMCLNSCYLIETACSQKGCFNAKRSQLGIFHTATRTQSFYTRAACMYMIRYYYIHHLYLFMV